MRCGPRLGFWAIVRVPWGMRQLYLGWDISSGCKDKKLVVTDEQKGPNTKEPGSQADSLRSEPPGKQALSPLALNSYKGPQFQKVETRGIYSPSPAGIMSSLCLTPCRHFPRHLIPSHPKSTYSFPYQAPFCFFARAVLQQVLFSSSFEDS